MNNKKFDPETGDEYNLEVFPPSDESVMQRLIEKKETSEASVRKLYRTWRTSQKFIEEAYRSITFTFQSDRTIEDLQTLLCEELESYMKA